MSTRRFRTGHRPDQPLLLPPAVTDWLPPDHPVYGWSALVEELDLTPIDADYGPKGQPPYDPWVMVKIWVYAYARGIRASRQVERACHDDVGFRVLSGNLQPDCWTLAALRRRHLTARGDLLRESVRLAQAVGWVPLRDVAVDGPQIKAAASQHRAMSYAHLVAREQELAEEVAGYLRDVETADQAGDAAYGAEGRGGTAPAGLADAQQRLATIRAAKARLEAEAQARAAAAPAEKAAKAQAAGKPVPPTPPTPHRRGPRPRTRRPQRTLRTPNPGSGGIAIKRLSRATMPRSRSMRTPRLSWRPTSPPKRRIVPICSRWWTKSRR